MIALKATELKLILSMVLCGLTYPIMIIFAFAGYFSLLKFEWVIAIFIFCLLREDKGRIVMMFGAALFFAYALSIAWYLALPIALLIADPMLEIYERNCIED